jgi:hypothetical protein
MVVGGPSGFSGGSPQSVFGNDQTHLLSVVKGSKIKAALRFVFEMVEQWWFKIFFYLKIYIFFIF